MRRAGTPGAVQPAVMVALKGALPAPKRTVDTSLLTSWLTLRAVEQQSRQLEAMEQAAREAAAAAAAAPPMPSRHRGGAAGCRRERAGRAGAARDRRNVGGAKAPALPPPITIAGGAASRAPRRAPTAPAAGLRAGCRSRLLGAQN